MVGLSTGWVVDRLSVPDFTLVASYPLPGAPGDGPNAAARTGDGRLVAVSGSQLTAWDTTTHDLVGGPFPVELQASNNPAVALRPGHPAEVALLMLDHTIALWDAETGTRTAMPPREGAERLMTYTMTFDRTGDRLAFFSHLNTIEVWDMREGRPAPPSIPVSTVYAAAGFDAQGHLLSQSATETGANQVTFWDLDAGRALGSIVLPAHDAGPISADGTRMALNGFGGAPPIELPLSPEQWRDALCTFADRPFAGHEIDALPPGFDTRSPCS